MSFLSSSSFVKRSNVTLYEYLAIQEADELHAAVVDEAGADERLAEDRVAPEGGGLGPEPGRLRARQLGTQSTEPEPTARARRAEEEFY